MAPIDPSVAKQLLEALIAGFAVLGGFMAYTSGFAAQSALEDDASPAELAHRINEGIGNGFATGAPFALVALMIMGWA